MEQVLDEFNFDELDLAMSGIDDLIEESTDSTLTKNTIRDFNNASALASQLVSSAIREIKKLQILQVAHNTCIYGISSHQKNVIGQRERVFEKKSISSHDDIDIALQAISEMVNDIEQQIQYYSNGNSLGKTFNELIHHIYLYQNNQYIIKLDKECIEVVRGKRPITTPLTMDDLNTLLALFTKSYNTLSHTRSIAIESSKVKESNEGNPNNDVQITSVTDFSYYFGLLPILEKLNSVLQAKAFMQDDSVGVNAIYQIDGYSLEQIGNYNSASMDFNKTVKLSAISVLCKYEVDGKPLTVPGVKTLKKRHTYYTDLHALKVLTNRKLPIGTSKSSRDDAYYTSLDLYDSIYQQYAKAINLPDFQPMDIIKVPIIIYDDINKFIYISAIDSNDETLLSVSDFLNSPSSKNSEYTNLDVLNNTAEFRSGNSAYDLYAEITACEENYSKISHNVYLSNQGYKMYTNAELGYILKRKSLFNVVSTPKYYNKVANLPLFNEDGLLNLESADILRNVYKEIKGVEMSSPITDNNVEDVQRSILKLLLTSSGTDGLYADYIPAGSFKGGFVMDSNITYIRNALCNKLLEYEMNEKMSAKEKFDLDRLDKVYQAHKKEVLQFYCEQFINNLHLFSQTIYPQIFENIYMKDEVLDIIISKAMSIGTSKFELSIQSFDILLVQDILIGFFLLSTRGILPRMDVSTLDMKTLEALPEIDLTSFTDADVSLKELWGYTPVISNPVKTNLPATSSLLLIIVIMKYYNGKITIKENKTQVKKEDKFAMNLKVPHLVTNDKSAIGYAANYLTPQQLAEYGFTQESYDMYKKYLYNIFASVILNKNINYFNNLGNNFAFEYILNSFIQAMSDARLDTSIPVSQYCLPITSIPLTTEYDFGNFYVVASVIYKYEDKCLLDLINYLLGKSVTNKAVTKYKPYIHTSSVPKLTADVSDEVANELNILAEDCLHLYRFSPNLIRNFVSHYITLLSTEVSITTNHCKALREILFNMNWDGNVDSLYIADYSIFTKEFSPMFRAQDISGSTADYITLRDYSIFKQFHALLRTVFKKVDSNTDANTLLDGVKQKLTNSIPTTALYNSSITRIQNCLKLHLNDESFQDAFVKKLLDEITTSIETLFTHPADRYKCAAFIENAISNGLKPSSLPVDKIRFKSTANCKTEDLKALYTLANKVKACIDAVGPFILNPTYKDLSDQYETIMKKLSEYIEVPKINKKRSTKDVSSDVCIRNNVLYKKYLSTGDKSILHSVDRDYVSADLLTSDKIGKYVVPGEYCIVNVLDELMKATPQETYIHEEWLQKSYEDAITELMNENPYFLEYLPLSIKEKYNLI